MAQKVLLTGANGFLGSHILLELLEYGFIVRSVVRSQPKADQIALDFPTYKSQMDFAVVPDMTTPSAFDQALQSDPPITTVIHQASPFFFASITTNKEFLDPAVKGTTSLLQSIKSHAPSVKRVIYTSSCAAIIDFTAPVATTPQKIYTEDDWNPIKYADALTSSKADAYRASKKFAELAAWSFVAEEKPNFDLVSINPPMIWGPMIHTIKSVAEIGESNARLYANFVNSSKDGPLPPSGVHVYVDVRDLAVAHVRAVTEPKAGGERIIVSNKGIGSQGIADIFRAVPGLEERTPLGKPGTSDLPENAFGIGNEKAKRILGMEYRSERDTFDDLARQLLEIERAEKRK